MTQKSPNYRALDLMENSSHSAASIDRAPDSHCCQLRWVRCTSADASAVESPADSRACRISDGVGLGIDSNLPFSEPPNAVVFNRSDSVMPLSIVFEVQGDFVGNNPVVTASADLAGDLFDKCAGFFARSFVIQGADDGFKVFNCFHDLLRLFGLRCATHDFTIANNVRVRNSYFASNENNFARAA